MRPAGVVPIALKRAYRRHRRGQHGSALPPLSIGDARAASEVPYGEVRRRVRSGERMAARIAHRAKAAPEETTPKPMRHRNEQGRRTAGGPNFSPARLPWMFSNVLGAKADEVDRAREEPRQHPPLLDPSRRANRRASTGAEPRTPVLRKHRATAAGARSGRVEPGRADADVRAHASTPPLRPRRGRADGPVGSFEQPMAPPQRTKASTYATSAQYWTCFAYAHAPNPRASPRLSHDASSARFVRSTETASPAWRIAGTRASRLVVQRGFSCAAGSTGAPAEILSSAACTEEGLPRRNPCRAVARDDNVLDRCVAGCLDLFVESVDVAPKEAPHRVDDPRRPVRRDGSAGHVGCRRDA